VHFTLECADRWRTVRLTVRRTVRHSPRGSIRSNTTQTSYTVKAEIKGFLSECFIKPTKLSLKVLPSAQLTVVLLKQE
jgi:hypothetical protein